MYASNIVMVLVKYWDSISLLSTALLSLCAAKFWSWKRNGRRQFFRYVEGDPCSVLSATLLSSHAFCDLEE
jgi:hypothetical protein